MKLICHAQRMRPPIWCLLNLPGSTMFKYLLVMKLTALLLTVGCLQLSASALSQEITASFKKATLEQVLHEIGKQSHYNFIYDSNYLTQTVPVTAELKRLPVAEALQTVFAGQPLTYEIEDNTIYVRPTITLNEKDVRAENFPPQRTITGHIVDATGKPVVGATISIQGKNTKAVANDRGRFAIAAEAGQTLVITAIGFATKEIKLGAQQDLGAINLEQSTSNLDEVNVVAYGTSTRREATGAVSVVKGKELEGIPSASLANLLQGRVAGMDITNISGSPGGGGIAITIRGYNSLDVEQGRRFSNPLWVVDGVPLNSFTSPVTGTNMLADINPDMIESIQVLKDASSASLYGSRAANGVIIVTTKKGSQNQKAEFSANVSQTYSVLPQLPTVTIGRAERDFRLQALRNNRTTYLNTENMRYMYPTSLLDAYQNPNSSLDYFFSALPGTDNGLFLQDSLNSFYNNATNFFPMYFETGKITNANIQTYGGAKNISYGMGLGYYNEAGVLTGTGFSRVDLNSNLNASPTPKLQIDLRFNTAVTDRNRGERAGSLNAAPIIETVPGDPYELSSLFPGEGSTVWNNVLDRLSGTQEENRSVRLRPNFRIGYDILPELNFSSSIGADYAIHRRNYFQPSYLSEAGYSRSLGETGINMLVLNENLLSYKKTIKDNHNLTGIVGFSYQYDRAEYNGGSAQNSPSDKIYYAPPGLPILGQDEFGSTSEIIAFQRYNSNMEEQALMSYFGRAEYNYKQKYLVSASFRRDGSSVFGPNNKWGTFPSLAGGWAFSEENFVKDNLPWLNFGKFRASWGRSGMHFSQPYLALGIMEVGNTSFQGNGVLVPEYNEGLYNDDLSWEETDQYDFGFDIDILKHRISITADYYYRYTDKMLMLVRLPGRYSGYISQWRNAGAVSNEGIELLVNFEIIRKPDIFWKVSVNGTKNWNRFEKSYDGMDVGGRIIGKSLSGIYTLVTDGYINDQESQPIFYNAGGISNYFGRTNRTYYTPGDYNFIDVNGDGVLNSSDQIYAGSALPAVSGGLVNEFRWKNFDLNLLMSFQLGRNMINATPVSSIRTNTSSLMNPILIDLDQISFWEEVGDDNADFAKLQYDHSNGVYDLLVDRYVEKVNWLKLKTAVVGYSLPKTWTQRVNMENIRFFLSGENLLTFTNYSGIDPEIVSINTGIDNGTNYPLARKFTLGLTVKF